MCRRYWDGCCHCDGEKIKVECGGNILNCDYISYLSIRKDAKEMATKNNVSATNEWYAQQIRKVGEFLVKNADLLVPDVKETFGIDIRASINPMEQTEIEVKNRFVPKIS